MLLNSEYLLSLNICRDLFYIGFRLNHLMFASSFTKGLRWRFHRYCLTLNLIKINNIYLLKINNTEYDENRKEILG